MAIRRGKAAASTGINQTWINTANELTKLMDLDPPIDVTKEDVLKAGLIEAGAMLEKTDKISDEANSVLTSLGVKLPFATKKVSPKKAAEAPEDEEEGEETEEEEEEAPPEDEEEEPDEFEAMNRDELKAYIFANLKEKGVKVFKTDDEEALRKKIRDAVPKTKTTKKAAVPRDKTRAQIMKEIMDAGGGSIKELSEKMQKLYKGGSSSESEANFQVGIFVRILSEFDVISKDKDGIYTLKA